MSVRKYETVIDGLFAEFRSVIFVLSTCLVNAG